MHKFGALHCIIVVMAGSGRAVLTLVCHMLFVPTSQGTTVYFYHFHPRNLNEYCVLILLYIQVFYVSIVSRSPTWAAYI